MPGGCSELHPLQVLQDSSRSNWLCKGISARSERSCYSPPPVSHNEVIASVIRHDQSALLVDSSVALRGPFGIQASDPVLAWCDSPPEIHHNVAKTVARNRNWQKQNLGGGAVTHRRLTATEIVGGGLDFNGFHTSAPSSAEPRALCSYRRITTVRSDRCILQKDDPFIGFRQRMLSCTSWKDMGPFLSPKQADCV